MGQTEVERLAAMLDERRLAIVVREHGIGKARSAADTPANIFASPVCFQRPNLKIALDSVPKYGIYNSREIALREAVI